MWRRAWWGGGGGGGGGGWVEHKGSPRKVPGSYVTASEQGRLGSEGSSMGTCFNNAGALVI